VQLQERKPATTLITQNVDGLLTKAGAHDVLELHGSLLRERCIACGAVLALAQGGADPARVACPSCGGTRFRPDVVMFGEFLDEQTWARADLLSKTAEVYLLVGTSAVVYPAAGLAEKAVARGAKLVVVNLEPTPLDELAHAVIRARTEDVLPDLVEAL